MTNAVFDDRLALIASKRRQLSRGVVYRVGRDGLLTASPSERLAPKLPGRSLVYLLLASIALKTALYVGLGAATYETRLDSLRAGTQVEQVAHWLLQIDPVTAYMIDTVESAKTLMP